MRHCLFCIHEIEKKDGSDTMTTATNEFLLSLCSSYQELLRVSVWHCAESLSQWLYAGDDDDYHNDDDNAAAAAAAAHHDDDQLTNWMLYPNNVNHIIHFHCYGNAVGVYNFPVHVRVCVRVLY